MCTNSNTDTLAAAVLTGLVAAAKLAPVVVQLLRRRKPAPAKP